MKVYDDEDILSGIYEVIRKQKEDDHKEMRDLEKKAFDEVKVAYEKISAYVKSEKITNSTVLSELSEYKRAVEGQYQSSMPLLDDLHEKLSYSLMILVEDGSEQDLKFAQGFGKVSDERRISK